MINSHMARKSFKETLKFIDKDAFEKAVNGSSSKKEVMERLDLEVRGTSGYRILSYYSSVHGVALPVVSGKTRTSKAIFGNSIPLENIFNGGHPNYNTTDLRKRLVKEGYMENKCEICNLSEWMSMPIPLVLDHINGISWDHRLENLRIICRNCDGQTDTFCGKNASIERKKEKQIERIELLKSGKIKPRNAKEIFIRDEHLVEIVLNSGIDFQSRGWVKEVAPLINRSRPKVTQWMKIMMPDFLDTCYKGSNNRASKDA